MVGLGGERFEDEAGVSLDRGSATRERFWELEPSLGGERSHLRETFLVESEPSVCWEFFVYRRASSDGERAVDGPSLGRKPFLGGKCSLDELFLDWEAFLGWVRRLEGAFFDCDVFFAWGPFLDWDLFLDWRPFMDREICLDPEAFLD